MRNPDSTVGMNWELRNAWWCFGLVFVSSWWRLMFPGDSNIASIAENLLLSGRGLASTWKKQDCPRASMSRLHPPTPTAAAATTCCWCSPCQLPGHKISQGRWNWTEQTIGFQNKEKIRHLLLPYRDLRPFDHLICKVSVTSWEGTGVVAITLFALHKLLWQFWQILDWFLKYSPQKPGFLCLQTLSRFIKNPILHSDASSFQKDGGYRSLQLPTPPPPPPHSASIRPWHMPGPGPQFLDSVCLTSPLLGLPHLPSSTQLLASSAGWGPPVKGVFLHDAFFHCPVFLLPIWASTTVEDSHLARDEV